MKKLIIIITALLSALACTNLDDILEQLRDHEERIQKLEELCTQLNSNVEAIQTILTALEQNDYITDITKITEAGIEIGYSITFAKGGTVNIYHGSNGSDAPAPKIGIRKASDGEYYWTSGDEWLTDENGEKIPASVPNDPDGKYITPLFRVAENIWYISYDNGNTWKAIEKVGEETDKVNGKHGKGTNGKKCKEVIVKLHIENLFPCLGFGKLLVYIFSAKEEPEKIGDSNLNDDTDKAYK